MLEKLRYAFYKTIADMNAEGLREALKFGDSPAASYYAKHLKNYSEEALNLARFLGVEHRSLELTIKLCGRLIEDLKDNKPSSSRLASADLS